MKPVVVLTLIASALSGKPRAQKGEVHEHTGAPISGEEARRETAVAVIVIVVALALVLALVLSFIWMPGV